VGKGGRKCEGNMGKGLDPKKNEARVKTRPNCFAIAGLILTGLNGSQKGKKKKTQNTKKEFSMSRRGHKKGSTELEVVVFKKSQRVGRGGASSTPGVRVGLTKPITGTQISKWCQTSTSKRLEGVGPRKGGGGGKSNARNRLTLKRSKERHKKKKKKCGKGGYEGDSGRTNEDKLIAPRVFGSFANPPGRNAEKRNWRNRSNGGLGP